MNKLLVLLLPFSLMALTVDEMVQETLEKNPNSAETQIGGFRGSAVFRGGGKRDSAGISIGGI